MDILIATKNPGKFKEIREMLGGLEAFGGRFYSLEDLEIEDDFEETGRGSKCGSGAQDELALFEENALGKARFYADLAGMMTVADDSGIFVEALADELGVETRRWGAGHEAGDEDWLAHFMERMAEEKNRRAKFICAAALVGRGDAAEGVEGGGEKVFFGETCGVITLGIEAPVKAGIPLSSVFRPDGHEQVYAALNAAEKNELSHRGKAFLQLLNHLRNV